MSDPRLTPDPAWSTRTEPRKSRVPVVDLCRAPTGPATGNCVTAIR